MKRRRGTDMSGRGREEAGLGQAEALIYGHRSTSFYIDSKINSHAGAKLWLIGSLCLCLSVRLSVALFPFFIPNAIPRARPASPSQTHSCSQSPCYCDLMPYFVMWCTCGRPPSRCNLASTSRGTEDPQSGPPPPTRLLAAASSIVPRRR